MTNHFLLDLLLSLAPALLAIFLALGTKKVVPSLAAGVFAGALVAHQGGVLDALASFLDYFLDAIVPGLSELTLTVNGKGTWAWGYLDPPTPDFALDYSHLVITAFSILVAATVAVMGRSGATRAVVSLVERLAKTPRGAMVASWLSGGIVFFDDYANCLVVGSTMAPVVDRFRVSRAKLAYIVDSTAAPVASLALVSTWVGAEVSWIHDELVRAGSSENAFSVFLSALPYRFYGIFTLFFVGAIAVTGRDYGPMWEEERKARAGESRPIDLGPGKKNTGNMWVAVLPICTLVGGTFAWMFHTGRQALLTAGGTDAYEQAALYDIIGNADAFWSMLYGSIAAFILACLLAVVFRTAPVTRLPEYAWSGTKPVMGALGILFMAWALGSAMEATQAKDHLSQLLEGDAAVSISQPDGIQVRWDAGQKIETGAVWVARSGSDQRIGGAVKADELASGQARVTPDKFGDALGDGEWVVGILPMPKSSPEEEIAVAGPPWFPSFLFPSVVFLLAACTAFATGTSFGTMAILLPLAIPVSMWFEPTGIDYITLSSTAAVLAGSCLGDHASPISDTTVLSSIGAGVDLVTHVRTQLPYALTAGVISILVGYIPAGLGISPWWLIPIGGVTCIVAVRLLGRPTEILEPQASDSKAL